MPSACATPRDWCAIQRSKRRSGMGRLKRRNFTWCGPHKKPPPPPAWFTMEPMKSRVRFRLFVAVLVSCGAIPKPLLAEAVPVRQTEGLIHGFLVLRALNGDSLATGDLSQVAHGD